MDYILIFTEFLSTQYHLADRTKLNYLSNIRNVDLSSAQALSSSLQIIAETKSNSSYNNVIKALRKFRYALESHNEDHPIILTLKELKMTKVKRKSPFIPYTPEEVRKILELATGWKYQALWIAFNTGLRREEIRRLNINDIDLETGMITVRRGKGNKRRYVFVRDKSVLKRWKMVRELRQIKGEHWLFNTSGIRPSMQTIHNLSSDDFKAADLKVNLHRCRVTYATHTYNLDDNQYILVKKQLGHSTPQSTNGYLQIPDELRRHKINQIVNLYSMNYGLQKNKFNRMRNQIGRKE